MAEAAEIAAGEARAYTPPRPYSLPPVAAFFRAMWRGDGDLLGLLPRAAYKKPITDLGYSRRSIVLFNEPGLVREILEDDGSRFPKSDLMVGALEPLIGQSIFVTDGPKWQRQRAMIDPAFSQLRIGSAFPAMASAVETQVQRLDTDTEDGRAISLDRFMSEITADIISRTVFSIPLESRMAQEVFDDFTVFERAVAQVEILKLIFDPAWKQVRQPPKVLEACARIRRNIGLMVDTHLSSDGARFDDIASAIIGAKDRDTGDAFTRDELIDQLGVFFLAGHETTASALTWMVYVLIEQPTLLQALREEIGAVAENGDIAFSDVRKLRLLHATFRETLRLYPPLTFMPRVALERTQVGSRKLRRGALIMISPWTMQRNPLYWQDPDRFDAMRFVSGGEYEQARDAYIPFGAGPHTCIGAGFALAESALIMARLIMGFDFSLASDAVVRPAARLTTRPQREIMVRVTKRGH